MMALVRTLLLCGETTMKTARLAVVCCVALTLSSCAAPKPEEYVVGKWEDKNHNTIDFRKDGTLSGKMRVGNILVPLDGKYRFVDEQTLQIESSSTLLPKGMATFKINRLDYREFTLTAQNGVMTMMTRPTQ